MRVSIKGEGAMVKGKTLIPLIAVLVFLTILPKTVFASRHCASEAFLITGIETEAEARSSAAARDIATDKAIEMAWRALLKRLVLAGEDVRVLEALNPRPLIEFIHIGAETVLARRYLARLDFCFDRLLVREVFRENGIIHAELSSAPMLLLPVYVSSRGAYLWREPNPWKATLKTIVLRHGGLVQLTLAEGLSIERSINAQDVLAGNRKTIADAARLTRSSAVITGIIEARATEDGIDIISSGALYDKDGRKITDLVSNTTRLSDSDGLYAALTDAGRQLVDEVDSIWRKDNRARLGEATVVRLAVQIDKIADWVAVLDMISGLEPVGGIAVKQLGRGGGLIDISLTASFASFNSALDQAGYRLDSTDVEVSGVFILSPRE